MANVNVVFANCTEASLMASTFAGAVGQMQARLSAPESMNYLIGLRVPTKWTLSERAACVMAPTDYKKMNWEMKLRYHFNAVAWQVLYLADKGVRFQPGWSLTKYWEKSASLKQDREAFYAVAKSVGFEITPKFMRLLWEEAKSDWFSMDGLDWAKSLYKSLEKTSGGFAHVVLSEDACVLNMDNWEYSEDGTYYVQPEWLYDDENDDDGFDREPEFVAVEDKKEFIEVKAVVALGDNDF